MMFQRSRSALSSMHLFFNVDVVVFCEGGASRNAADALELTLDGRTLDAMYWANVVSFHGLTKKYHFKSVGSKETLLTIASNVTAAGSTTVTVCIDSDYDVQLNKMIVCPRLAHTYGYSWESDVLDRSVLHGTLRHLVGPPPSGVLADMENSITQLERDLVRWCEVDVALKAKAKPCVLDRRAPLSVVDLAADPPRLSQAVLRRNLTAIGYQRVPKRVCRLQEATVLRVAFGKLISRLLYHLVHKFASRVVQGLRLDYDGFMRAAMTETFALLRAGRLTDLAEHMANQLPAFA